MGLPDLYPAQVGSPYTTLAAPYTTGEATMTVVDATKLPDAPNIVCLAGSVAGEFRYTGKDGNILQGVAALPGTPSATWPAGTFAFRGIAAYDLNSLIERVAYVTPAYYSPYDQAADTRLVTQLHAHTTESDGGRTPQQVVDMYSPDFDVLAISDHNKVTLQPISGMAPIVANEITMANGHMLSLFSDYTGGAETDLQTLIWRAEQAGGLIVMAHPNWHNLLPIGTIDNYKGYGAIEIFNTVCESDQHGKTGFAVDVWDHLLTTVSPYIWGVATDDFHANTQYVRQGLGRIIVFSRSTQLEDLKQALRQGSFVADVGMTNVDLRPPSVGHDRIALNCPGATAIRFIGRSGVLLSSVAGETAEYHNTGVAHYVRAEVIGSYADGFDTDSGNWLYPYGTWAIADGVLSITGGAGSTWTAAYLAKPIHGDSDIYVEYRPTAVSEHDVHWCGVALNSHCKVGSSGSVAASGYLMNHYLSEPCVRLWKIVNNVFTELAMVEIPAAAIGTQYCARLQRDGYHIRGKIWAKADTEPTAWLFDVEDSDNSHGWPMLAAMGLYAEFDNFEIDGIKSYYQPVVIGTMVEVVGAYTDRFDSDTGNWLYPYGTWTIADGLLKCTVAQNLPPATACLAKPTQGDLDVYFEGRFDTCSETTTEYIGFGFHGHHATGVSGAHAMRSGYLFNFYTRGGSTASGIPAKLWRNDDGAFVELDSAASITPSVGTRYCFRVSRSGADIKIKYWVKGEAEPDWVLEATDATYDQGTPFLVALGVTASFDNFEINGIKSYYPLAVKGTI